MQNSCHYTTLGIERGASKEAITAAYRRLAMKWHPDRHLDHTAKSGAEVKFKQIQYAYAVLSDESARSRYDYAARPSPEAHAWEDLERRRRENLPRGQSIKYKQTISFLDAVNGCEIDLDFSRDCKCDDCRGRGWKTWSECRACYGQGHVRRNVCSACKGGGKDYDACWTCHGEGVVPDVRRGSVNLPPGLIHGSVVRVRGRGWESPHGGLPGDIEITIAIAAERGWKAKGADIHGPITIGFATALLGGYVDVRLPTGKTITVTVPERTSSGKRIRLSGSGLVHRRENQSGDVILTASITVPKSRRKLTPEQEALLRELEV